MPEDNIIINQRIDNNFFFEFDIDIEIKENKLIKKYLREHFSSPYNNRNKIFYKLKLYFYIFRYFITIN
jgi:hypothetical protein